MREGQCCRQNHRLFERCSSSHEREGEQRFAVARFEAVERSKAKRGKDREKDQERRLRAACKEVGQSGRPHYRTHSPGGRIVATNARVRDASVDEVECREIVVTG